MTKKRITSPLAELKAWRAGERSYLEEDEVTVLLADAILELSGHVSEIAKGTADALRDMSNLSRVARLL